MNVRISLLIAIVLVGSFSTCYAEDVKELILTPEQMKQYANAYKMPEVLHLRQFLNTYANSRDKVDSSEEEAARELDAKHIKKEIIRARFVVYWIEGFLGGGKVITIVSQEHPEIILDFWVYKVTDWDYQVRRLLDKPDERDLEAFKKRFRRFLNDKNLAM